jgi:hypothetical protein
MPRLELRDHFGTTFAITSQNLETIARWLTEWLPQLASPNVSLPPLQLSVYPMPLGPDYKQFDWPMIPRTVALDAGGVGMLLAALRAGGVALPDSVEVS